MVKIAAHRQTLKIAFYGVIKGQDEEKTSFRGEKPRGEAICACPALYKEKLLDAADRRLSIDLSPPDNERSVRGTL